MAEEKTDEGGLAIGRVRKLDGQMESFFLLLCFSFSKNENVRSSFNSSQHQFEHVPPQQAGDVSCS